MTRKTVDLATFRRDMKQMGYGVSVRSGSDFDTAAVRKDGVKINGGSVLTQEHLDEHRSFYDYKNSTSVLDGQVRVMF